MAILPSGYKPIVYLESDYSSSSSTNAYFDTGVYPKNTLRIESVFRGGQSSASSIYFFGARNTNSTTSNGQLSFGANTDGNPLIAYYNSQSVVDKDGYLGRENFFGKDGNELTYYTGRRSKTLVGSETAFTGTRTMYILARNNAGSPQYGNYVGVRAVIGVRIWDDDVLIREYLPAYEEATGRYGLYETVSGTFILKAGGNNDFTAMRPFTVTGSEGGDAVIDDDRFDDIREILVVDNIFVKNVVKIRAIPKQGYVFDYWDDNGTVASRESELVYEGVYDDQTHYHYFASNLTARFVKKTDIRQDNGYRAMLFPYGGTAEGQTDQTTNLFAKVKSASIVEDIMGRSVSTIVLEDAPTSIPYDVPIIVTDQLNKQVFIGIVKSVSGNTLTVYEPLSILDTDYLLRADFNSGGETITRHVERVLDDVIDGYMEIGAPLSMNFLNLFMVKKWSSIEVDNSVDVVYLNTRLNYISNAPAIENTEVVNAEEYVLNLANDYVIVVKPVYVKNRNPSWSHLYSMGQAISIDVINPNAYSKIVFGNNSEEISNITIEVEEAENTVLHVFNETGATLRGVYATKKDETIVKVPTAVNGGTFPSVLYDFIANEDCKVKVVNSNETIQTLKRQYLSNSFLNHKITFDVDLTTGAFRMEDFELGRPVDFYYGNKMYQSMVTAREYSIVENHDDITTLHITLGKVRTALTSKMNMRNR